MHTANKNYREVEGLIFYESLSAVCQDNKWGFVDDKSGALVIPCKWDAVRFFREGLAAVRQGDKWGFIDESGTLVISCQWGSVRDFHEGLAAVSPAYRLATGYIDRTGTLVIPCDWSIGHDFSNGSACVEDWSYGEADIVCYIDYEGNVLEERQYVQEFSF